MAEGRRKSSWILLALLALALVAWFGINLGLGRAGA
jgi:uncharacterized membrane protein